eukprot:CAMPEP_0175063600 /NCGR_PEP_ID=MMETSP0052_2-20121109/14849_1 /TAXON_ID=51329 ORGANISM="Polytomella parva, Strain SAG 63-3" /NCGR_SAMPLE_ID=MMETSP0052_2 /ASSEMBLY_ACC=CAM_ASM_000194 /LENGTH=622 /DNA_ID=CAMNT_0016329821 /DNA_START=372 /DNA_END=2240 /DNA_ORIENTATION=-
MSRGLQRQIETPQDLKAAQGSGRQLEFPLSAVGRFRNGCTGFLVGPCHVLTVAHCVYDPDRDIWWPGLEFLLGLNTNDDSGVAERLHTPHPTVSEILLDAEKTLQIPYRTVEVPSEWRYKNHFSSSHSFSSSSHSFFDSSHSSASDYALVVLGKDVSQMGVGWFDIFSTPLDGVEWERGADDMGDSEGNDEGDDEGMRKSRRKKKRERGRKGKAFSSTCSPCRKFFSEIVNLLQSSKEESTSVSIVASPSMTDMEVTVEWIQASSDLPSASLINLLSALQTRLSRFGSDKVSKQELVDITPFVDSARLDIRSRLESISAPPAKKSSSRSLSHDPAAPSETGCFATQTQGRMSHAVQIEIPVKVAGYPDDRKNGSLWYESCTAELPYFLTTSLVEDGVGEKEGKEEEKKEKGEEEEEEKKKEEEEEGKKANKKDTKANNNNKAYDNSRIRKARSLRTNTREEKIKFRKSNNNGNQNVYSLSVSSSNISIVFECGFGRLVAASKSNANDEKCNYELKSPDPIHHNCHTRGGNSGSPIWIAIAEDDCGSSGSQTKIPVDSKGLKVRSSAYAIGIHSAEDKKKKWQSSPKEKGRPMETWIPIPLGSSLMDDQKRNWIREKMDMHKC